MPIDNGIWHARVGIFNALRYLVKSKPKYELNILLYNSTYSLLAFLFHVFTFYLSSYYSFLNNFLTEEVIKFLKAIIALSKKIKILTLLFFCMSNILIQCGDVEQNPGPKYSSLKFCHWNLNGLMAHDSSKKSSLQAYITQHNYDIVCLSETFLNSETKNDDEKVEIEGYTLIRSDHPSDSKKGGVCIYYKEHIPLIRRDDLCMLDGCLVIEIRSQNEKCFLTCIYRSPNQNCDEFDNFCLNFESLLSKINNEFPLCSVVTGDFNARNSRWWKNDITNSFGKEIETLTSSAGYSQLIDKPTHIINDSRSCIDLIFCTNKNVITNSGVDVSIYKTCHHNIIFGKINISVPLPPVYIREVWDYKNADVEHIKKAISNFDWKNVFHSLKDVGEVN